MATSRNKAPPTWAVPLHVSWRSSEAVGSSLLSRSPASWGAGCRTAFTAYGCLMLFISSFTTSLLQRLVIRLLVLLQLNLFRINLKGEGGIALPAHTGPDTRAKATNQEMFTCRQLSPLAVQFGMTTPAHAHELCSRLASLFFAFWAPPQCYGCSSCVGLARAQV